MCVCVNSFLFRVAWEYYYNIMKWYIREKKKRNRININYADVVDKFWFMLHSISTYNRIKLKLDLVGRHHFKLCSLIHSLHRMVFIIYAVMSIWFRRVCAHQTPPTMSIWWWMQNASIEFWKWLNRKQHFKM